MEILFAIIYGLIGLLMMIVSNLVRLRRERVRVVRVGDLFYSDELKIIGFIFLWPVAILAWLVLVILYPFGLLMERLSKITIYEKKDEE